MNCDCIKRLDIVIIWNIRRFILSWGWIKGFSKIRCTSERIAISLRSSRNAYRINNCLSSAGVWGRDDVVWTVSPSHLWSPTTVKRDFARVFYRFVFQEYRVRWRASAYWVAFWNKTIRACDIWFGRKTYSSVRVSSVATLEKWSDKSTQWSVTIFTWSWS